MYIREDSKNISGLKAFLLLISINEQHLHTNQINIGDWFFKNLIKILFNFLFFYDYFLGPISHKQNKKFVGNGLFFQIKFLKFKKKKKIKFKRISGKLIKSKHNLSCTIVCFFAAWEASIRGKPYWHDMFQIVEI